MRRVIFWSHSWPVRSVPYKKPLPCTAHDDPHCLLPGCSKVRDVENRGKRPTIKGVKARYNKTKGWYVE